MRRPSHGRSIQPTQHRPSSTASVALCVAAENAMNPNSTAFSSVEIRSPCRTRMKSASTERPAKMSVSSMLSSQGKAVVAISARLIAMSRTGRARSSTRSVSCRIHSVARVWMPRLSQKSDVSPTWR